MTIETLVFSLVFFKLVRLYDGSYNRELSSFIFIVNRSIFFMAIFFLLGSQYDPEFFYRTTHGGDVFRLGGLIINPNELGLLSKYLHLRRFSANEIIFDHKDFGIGFYFVYSY